jgi:hypothetical protein
MMTLYEKIRFLHPELKDSDFDLISGVISLQDNSDGNGAFISKWQHPSIPMPNIDDLNGLKFTSTSI